MGNDGKHRGGTRPANDNRPPEGSEIRNQADASARLDAVVLSIARLIGRQIAREHFKAAQAANDNNPPARQRDARDDRSSGEDDP